MKKIYLLLALLFLLNHLATAQTVTLLGTPFVQDNTFDLMQTMDGNFLTTGTKANNGILYKTGCAGNIIAQLEKSFSPYPLTLFDAVELPDHSIVAVGYAALVQTPADTLDHLVLLKTNASLNEIAFAHYPLSGKSARGKSLAVGQDGTLLIYGEIQGPFVDFWDMFFLRVNPFTLQPAAAPVIYTFGVDNSQQIVPVGNNEFLLSGFSLIGNIFNPEAMITNRLVTLKVNDQGGVIWQYFYQKTYKGKYGFCKSGGAAIHPATGNIMMPGVIYSGAPDSLADPIFILLNGQGTPLDTAIELIPGRQNLFKTIANSADYGAHLAVGETLKAAGYSTLLLMVPREFNNQIFNALAVNDTVTPVSLRDIVEVTGNRFAFVGTLPDNPLNFGIADIILATPELDNIEILYQNCALVASLSAPDPSYQWYLNGQPIAGATSGFYFPVQTGSYQVYVTDAIGCVGASDTLTVTLPAAGFNVSAGNGTYSFTNTSVAATAYFWDFGDGQTSTQANPVHTYTTSGPYTVTLIASSPCGADTMTNALVGAAEPSWLQQFRLFPNPNDGVFSLETNGQPQDELVFSFFNQVGQVIDRQTFDFQSGNLRHTFEFGDLAPGVYIFQIQAKGEAKYARVVVR